MAEPEYKTVRLNTERLGQILLTEGVISADDLNRALRVQTEKGGLIGEILIELGIVTPRDIERVLFLQYGTGFPFVLLPEERIIPLEVIAQVPRDVAEKYCLIPFSRFHDVLTVIISNPLDKEGLFKELKEITGLEIQFFLGLSSQIKRAVKFYYELLEKKRKKEEKGFTLIELMLVVVIIGILAAMVVPRLGGRARQARESAAKADIEANMALALDLYEMDNGEYPANLDALLTKPGDATKWSGPYLKKKPLDPWEKEYYYLSPGINNPHSYDLYSSGPDKQRGTSDDIKNW